MDNSIDPTDNTMMMESDAVENRVQDEQQDSTPVFLDANDAIEVQVDDDHVPMDEEEENQEEESPLVDDDMSKTKFEAHTGQVYAVAAHYDNDSSLSILSGGGDDKAFMHTVVQQATSVSTMLLDFAHSDSVACVAFNHKFVSDDLTKTPKLAAVGGYDGAIVIYDSNGNKLQQLEGPSDVEWLCFHPKGGTVLLAGSVADGTVWMYHLPLNKCLQVFVGHESGVTAGSFSTDGKWALSASSDGTLRVWAPKTGVSKHVFRFTFNEETAAGLTCLAIGGGADGQLVVVGAEDGMAHVCHVATKKVVASLRHFETPIQQQNDEKEEIMELPMSVEAIGFSPSNPNWCATGGVDGVLKVWDLTHDNGTCRQVCRPNQDTNGNDSSNNNNMGGITRLKWHPTLPLVFSSCSDGTVRLWDARSGRLLETLTGHTDMINDLAVEFISPERGGGTAVVVTGSDDKTVRVFEVDIAASLTKPAEQHSSTTME